MNPYNIIQFPKTTEKCIRIMESENKVVFQVARKSKKSQIKAAVQEAFKVKVVDVNTVITPQGVKKAYVKLAPENPAMDLASELGIM